MSHCAFKHPNSGNSSQSWWPNLVPIWFQSGDQSGSIWFQSGSIWVRPCSNHPNHPNPLLDVYGSYGGATVCWLVFADSTRPYELGCERRGADSECGCAGWAWVTVRHGGYDGVAPSGMIIIFWADGKDPLANITTQKNCELVMCVQVR